MRRRSLLRRGPYAIIRAMLINAPCVVSLTWHLADAQGQAIDDLTEPLEFFFGGDDLLPKLEEALAGQQTGFQVDLRLEPEQGFGEYNAELVCFEERSLFPEHIEEGMQFDGLPAGAASQGMPPDTVYSITEIYDTHVVLDGNHPLAGIGLQLAVTVCDVRGASADEVAAKTVATSEVSVLSALPVSRQVH